jgi:hypothetical protein
MCPFREALRRVLQGPRRGKNSSYMAVQTERAKYCTMFINGKNVAEPGKESSQCGGDR